MNIRLVRATRLGAAEFHETSALGRSLRVAYADVRGLELALFPGGNPGLPVVYNQAIRAAAGDPTILLFIHDDVHLIDNGLYFDEAFDFNCWDMDFCRQAESKGITMWTVPIGVEHESAGKFRTEARALAYKRYIDKWGD